MIDGRVLITGGAGFLGSHIAELIPGAICPRKRDYDLTSARSTALLFADERPAVVIHAAAAVGGIGANMAHPGKFLYDNAMMGLNVLQQCAAHQVRKLVMIGTTCSYPKHTPIPFQEAAIWDGYPEETNAPYGIAKKMLLAACQAYRREYGMDAIYLLPANLYGPRDNFNPDSSHVIPAIIRKCFRAVEDDAETVTLWGDGSATREFLHVEDAARAIVLATERYSSIEPANIGNGREISIREVALRIAALVGFRGRIVWDESKPNGQPRRCLDTSRAEGFGFKASTQIEEGLRTTIQWYREHR